GDLCATVSLVNLAKPPGDVMKLPRRKFLYLAAGAVALPAISRTARAQTYPTPPVGLVVGFDACCPADILARTTGDPGGGLPPCTDLHRIDRQRFIESFVRERQALDAAELQRDPSTLNCGRVSSRSLFDHFLGAINARDLARRRLFREQ